MPALLRASLRRRETALAGIILLLMLAIGLRAPVFLAPASLAGLASDTAILAILVLGQMLVILTRGIDLSVAANMALTGMLMALLSTTVPALPGIAYLLLGAACGLALGAINGLLVWRVGIPAIVATLGTLSIYRGAVFLLTDGRWVNSNEMSAAFLAFPRQTPLGLDLFTWLAVLAALALRFVLGETRFGRTLMPRAAIRGPPPIPGSTRCGSSSWPSACRGRWPVPAAISGCRATPSPMSTRRLASSCR